MEGHSPIFSTLVTSMMVPNTTVDMKMEAPIRALDEEWRWIYSCLGVDREGRD